MINIFFSNYKQITLKTIEEKLLITFEYLILSKCKTLVLININVD